MDGKNIFCAIVVDKEKSCTFAPRFLERMETN